MIADDCGSGTNEFRFLERSRLGALLVLSLTAACGGIGNSQTVLPSRKEFFLRRDTPVDSVRVAITEVAVSASTPAGEVDGIVVDGYWAEPVAYAQIVYRDAEHPQESVGAISDADGHFRITRLPARSVVIRASLIGYLADTIRVDGKSGQFVRFGLRRQATRACGLPVQSDRPREAPFAISVSVRDSRTGKAPAVPVAISLRDGRFIDSATIWMRDGPADSILVGAAPGRDGVYDVEVTARGYKSWSLRRVRPAVSDCDEVVGRIFSAWLIPTS